ncbi:MAG: 1-acyl-sn-glycerol-3-phosphate acyltransferase [Micavibrio sp.]|nr:1-acyl-sn-glycerol-3-phosphate acyltransferase [Micavibrio sp.]|tara:strand:- start:55957 stop:56727 length:771 start_codon:yes stop_codon:yes gene_type:complete
MIRSSIAFLKICAFLLWCLLCVPPQLLVKLIFRNQVVHALPYLWHKGICFIFRIKVQVEGNIDTARPLLYAVNHFSYLDIPVLGSRLVACFIAKKEVAGWPVFGFLSKLQNTAFIDRRLTAAKAEMQGLQGYTDHKRRLILFPEGTSTEGDHAIAFRSNFFEICAGKEKIPIQPVSLSLVAIENMGITTQKQRDLYAWYGDMDLAPHLWSFAKSKGATVKLTFHAPFLPTSEDDRKSVALKAEQAVHNVFGQKRVL